MLQYTFLYKQVSSPVNQPQTKFGGLPQWIEKPQWPVSKSTGEPMRFIGQIELEEKIFGNIKGKMAYLFINPDESEDAYGMDQGENAIVIQPNNDEYESNVTGSILTFSGRAIAMGMDKNLPCEFVLEKNYGEVVKKRSLDSFETGELRSIDFDNQVGGVVDWLQCEEETFDNAKLLIQFHDADAPFVLTNDFPMGQGYAFIDANGENAKLFWQTT